MLLLNILDGLPLECDGMTRVISTLMQRDHIAHRVFIGSVVISGIDVNIPHHWWIEFSDGRLCDLRARMWLGSDERIPHGVFVPQPYHIYQAQNDVQPESICLNPFMFQILTMRTIESFQNSNELLS